MQQHKVSGLFSCLRWSTGSDVTHSDSCDLSKPCFKHLKHGLCPDTCLPSCSQLALMLPHVKGCQGCSPGILRRMGPSGFQPIVHKLVQGTGRQNCSIALPKHSFPAPVPCRLLPGLWEVQSPSSAGSKQRTQEHCDRAPAHPSKSLLEMQNRARNWILSLPQERQQPEKFPLTIQDMSQHQETEEEKMHLLHFADESGRGWAGGNGALGRRCELCTASLHSAAGAPCSLYILPASGFHFLWGKEVGSFQKFQF